MSSQPDGRPKYVLNGVFSTWEAASADAAAIGGEGLGGSKWLERITRQVVEYRDEVRQHGIAMPPRPCSLPLACATTNPGAIVDFGGSSGWAWDYLQNTMPGHTVYSYVVVETEAVATYMRNSGIHGAPVEYLTLGDRLGPCDLLYCNSVLQYFESNAPLLSLIESAAPKYVLLEDVATKEGGDFFSVQSYRGSAIPYRFPGLETLLRDLSNAGYGESTRFPYASPVNGAIKPLEMGHFPEGKRLRYASSMLFERAGDL